MSYVLGTVLNFVVWSMCYNFAETGTIGSIAQTECLHTYICIYSSVGCVWEGCWVHFQWDACMHALDLSHYTWPSAHNTILGTSWHSMNTKLCTAVLAVSICTSLHTHLGRDHTPYPYSSTAHPTTTAVLLYIVHSYTNVQPLAQCTYTVRT